jgi:hypothetical protein
MKQGIINALKKGKNYNQYLKFNIFVRNDIKKYIKKGRRIVAIETNTPTAKTTSVEEFKEHCR